MARSSSIRGELASRFGVQASEVGYQERQVSALVTLSISCGRRKKSKHMPTSTSSSRAKKTADRGRCRRLAVNPLHSSTRLRRVTHRLGFMYPAAAVIVLLIIFMQLARAGGPA